MGFFGEGVACLALLDIQLNFLITWCCLFNKLTKIGLFMAIYKVVIPYRKPKKWLYYFDIKAETEGQAKAIAKEMAFYENGSLPHGKLRISKQEILKG